MSDTPTARYPIPECWRQSALLMQDRSDARGKYFSALATTCRPDRIVIERNLCRPTPITRAKTYLELPRARRGDCVAGAMAVNQAF